ncbi:hypothetical protein PPROV_001064300 [Pycnococcus provasolii]|uniref:Uncharacterized protein n=2 Tax=Pycnococcus provasolii TaxID=41880 RepID=A0A830HWU2_9CHLO|nr:hypothetical protein PPROV_001064300 [Pycnococcus provasolii]
MAPLVTRPRVRMAPLVTRQQARIRMQPRIVSSNSLGGGGGRSGGHGNGRRLLLGLGMTAVSGLLFPSHAFARRLVDHSNFHIDNEFYSEGAHRFVDDNHITLEQAGCDDVKSQQGKIKCMKKARLEQLRVQAERIGSVGAGLGLRGGR